ncbi:hypothetical protein AB7828_03855 [Tardiphaga sp. 215_C5_N2_1]|uniref:hypothetical protein n=1 Tax=Tardiphaga sp. 215_C5_N2_1 TaxID=3240774 RepID=UPI003F8B8DF8
MSVTNIIGQSNAVHVITDGLMKREDGTFANVSKAVALPTLNAVVTVNGNCLGPGFFAAAINVECASVATLQVDMLRAVKKMVDLAPFLVEGSGFSITVTGWGDGEAFGYGLSTNANFGTPWEVTPLSVHKRIVMLPCSEEWAGDVRKIFPSKVDVDQIDVDRVANEIVLMQRRREPDGENVIGGMVSIASVSAAGIQTRITTRWPGHLKQLRN